MIGGIRDTASLEWKARQAGVLYLLVVVTGVFVIMYVPGQLYVPGDVAASTRNILASQSLFTAGLVVALVSVLAYLLLALALYRLLQGVDRSLAVLMVILVLVQIPLGVQDVVNQFSALELLRGGGMASQMDPAQRAALAMHYVDIDGTRTTMAMFFWGLWLFPLGALVVRSGFLPRFLGVWLIVNGVAYVVAGTTRVVAAEQFEIVRSVTTPLMLGELVFMFWLVVVGARVRGVVSPAFA